MLTQLVSPDLHNCLAKGARGRPSRRRPARFVWSPQRRWKCRFGANAGRPHRDAREAVMPVRIRLARYGHRNLPFYRIYVADSRAPRDGKHIEIIGHYDPKPGACPWRPPDAA